MLSALQSSATVRSEPTGFDPLPFGLRGSGTLLQNASDTEMNADHMMSQEKIVVGDEQRKMFLQFLLPSVVKCCPGVRFWGGAVGCGHLCDCFLLLPAAFCCVLLS